MKKISLFGLVALSSVILPFEGVAKDKISLELISTSAERIGPVTIPKGLEYVITNEVVIHCTAVIDNQTDTALTVMSSFYSAFDGFYFLVSDSNGKEIIRQPYIAHQSPSSLDRRPFLLPIGRTTNDLVGVTFFEVPGMTTSLRVRLEGTLPRSAFTRSLTSSVVEVAIKESYPPSAVRSLSWQTAKEDMICPSNSVVRNLSSEVCILDSTVGKISMPLMPGHTIFAGMEFRFIKVPDKVEMTTIPVNAGK